MSMYQFLKGINNGLDLMKMKALPNPWHLTLKLLEYFVPRGQLEEHRSPQSGMAAITEAPLKEAECQA